MPIKPRKMTASNSALHVLGLETSCDETGAAVIQRLGNGTGAIRANLVRSQLREHAAFGGVVPEIAARAHVEALDGLIAAAMQEAGLGFGDLSAVAVTAGPGLIGGLLVGVMTAKAIGLVHGMPVIPVNHLEGHALTVGLTEGVAPPYLLLLVSGGHTQLLAVHGLGRYERLGTTLDDALGEAFDKTAKLAGPRLSRRAGGRALGGRRRCQAIRPTAPDDRPRGTAFFLFRPQNRAAPGSAPAGTSRATPTFAIFALPSSKPLPNP